MSFVNRLFRNLQVLTLLGMFLCGLVSAAQEKRPLLVPTLGPTNKIATLAYSEDGRLLVMGASDGITSLWDVDTGAEIKRYVDTSAGVLYVRLFDHGEKLFTGSEDGKGRIWDTKSGAILHAFDGHVSVLAHDYLYGAPFALSADGSQLFTADRDGIGHIWDSRTGVELKRIPVKLGNVGYAEFAPKAQLIVIAGAQGVALFNLATSSEVWQAAGDSDAVAFIDDGTRVLTSGSEGIHVRDVSKGAIKSNIPLSSPFQMSISQDGKTLLGGTFSAGASAWDITSGKNLWKSPDVYPSGPFGANSAIAVSFSPDGQTLACAFVDRKMGSWSSHVRIFFTGTFAELKQLKGETTRLLSLGFRGHTPYLLGADQTGAAFLWRGDGKAVRYYDHLAPIINGSVSPDGSHVLLGSLDNSASLWSATGDERFHFSGHTQYVASTTFSHDGKYAFTTGGSGFKWSVETGQRLARFGGDDFDNAVLGLTVSGDDKYIYTQAFGHTRIWTPNGTEVELPKEFEEGSEGVRNEMTITTDGRLLTIGCGGRNGTKPPVLPGLRTECSERYRGVVRGISSDGEWVMSSAGTKAYLKNQRNEKVLIFDQERDVDFMELSGDSTLLLTGSLQDDIVHLWKTADGAELCSMVLMQSGIWIVVDKDGRFDTDNIEEMRGLNWIMPDDPLRPLPLEIFMRDYYTPGLLAQKLDGEISNVPDISSRDRNTPRVTFESFSFNDDDTRVRLTLKFSMGSQSERVEPFDLHVFRDGRLVARLPKNGGTLTQYMDHGLLEIPDVQLPSRPSHHEVHFSAYAFNRDHVKGPTATTTVPVKSRSPSKQGKAYLITFGVNTFDDPVWNLRFAANDARKMSDALSAGLRDTSSFSDVVPIPLVSDTRRDHGEVPATKDNLRSVLLGLAGEHNVINSDLANMSIVRTTPDDVIFIDISTHGYTDEKGSFFLLPTDIGPHVGKTVSSDLKSRSISSDDLSSWLLGVDAADTIVIVDACEAGAVAGKAFRAGPMGDRTFGQLAYNKKARVLVGSQADSVSLEVAELQHGLLTYALVQDGLSLDKADFNPMDHTITTTEWFQYAQDDVIKIQRLIAAGLQAGSTSLDETAIGAKGVKVNGASPENISAVVQRPVLFDFGQDTGPILWGHLFFDRGEAPDGVQGQEAELKAAISIEDPVASGAAIKRFIQSVGPDERRAVAWLLLVPKLLAAKAPSTELISASRMMLEYLGFVRDYQTAADILGKVSDVLDSRQQFSEVSTEFRTLSQKLTKLQ